LIELRLPARAPAPSNADAVSYLVTRPLACAAESARPTACRRLQRELQATAIQKIANDHASALSGRHRPADAWVHTGRSAGDRAQ